MSYCILYGRDYTYVFKGSLLVLPFFSEVEKLPNDVRNRLCDELLSSVRTHRHINSPVKLQNNQFIYLSWYLDIEN